MKKTKGFALLQALFFMMFIMAIISFAMMMSAQRNVSIAGKSMALDAYQAASTLLTQAAQDLSSCNSSSDPLVCNGTTYFTDHPLYPDYITKLTDENIGDPSIDCTGTCAITGPNLTITVIYD